MATSKTFSQLPAASSISNNDLAAIAHEDALAETGYESQKATMIQIGKKILGDIEYVTDLPGFPSDEQNPFAALLYLRDSILDLLPVDEVSGAIANFDTDVVLPLIDVKAEIKALETGTGAKSPSNPYVISGFTGSVIGHQNGDISIQSYFRNLFLGTYAFVNLGSLEWDRLSTDTTGKYRYRANIPDMKQGAWSAVGLLCSKYEIVATVYNVSVTGLTISTTEEYRRVLIHDSEIDTVTPEEFATAMNGVYLIYELATPATPTITPVQYQALCTAFDIRGTLYTVSWQTEAGEVFGGYYDFTTGKLVVTHIKLTETQLRSVNWSIGGTNSNLFGALLGNEYIYPTGANEKGDILSDIYENVGYTTINTATQAYQIALRNDGTIRIKDDRYATLQDFKNDLGNLNIVVKLATPVEYDLTQQQISPFLGINNMWNDTNGDTTVDYKLGIQKYIDKKIAEVQALVL